MTDEEPYMLTNYDIECLIHIYNKFTKYRDNPTTDPLVVLNRIQNYDILETSPYNNHHPRIISIQFATLLGDPTNLIMKKREIEEKFETYIKANCEHTDTERWVWLFMPNQAIRDIMKMPNTANMVAWNDGRFIYDNICDEHIQLYVQPDKYVLK